MEINSNYFLQSTLHSSVSLFSQLFQLFTFRLKFYTLYIGIKHHFYSRSIICYNFLLTIENIYGRWNIKGPFGYMAQ